MLLATLVLSAHVVASAAAVAPAVMSLAEATRRGRDEKPVHDGALVTVEGIASIGPDVLLGGQLQKVFIQDHHAGIALFARNQMLRVREGDTVRATGRIALFNGTVEVVVQTLQVIRHGTPPQPIRVRPEDLLGNRYSGRLVETEALVIAGIDGRGNTNIPIVAGSALANIHLTERQWRLFASLHLQRGTTVRVTGIASQYDRDPPYESGWQILPRGAGDLIVLQQPARLALRDLIVPGLVIALLVAAIVSWSLTLRHQVRRRTLDVERAAASLASSEERYRMLFEHNVAGLYRTAIDGHVIECNEAAARLLGYERTDLLGRNVNDLCADADDLRTVTRSLRDLGSVSDLELRLRRKDGSVVWVTATANRLQLASGDEVVDGTLIDITERKRAVEQMEFLAYHDALTGLPNRALFHDRLAMQLLQATRDSQPVAVMFMDIDRFKRINDTLGHSVGDLLLCEMANRLRQCLRAGDTVARFGGDEFALMARLNSLDGAEKVGRKVLKAVTRPFELGGQRVHVSASVGVALYPADGGDPESLIKCADLAMYRVKSAGRGNLQFASSTQDAAGAIDRLAVENELRIAVETDGLEVWYQPQIRVLDGRIVGAEALLRWEHGRRGNIPPSTFIPLAEDIRLIGVIGERVLRQACAQLSLWQVRFPELTMSVNVSALQLLDRHFVRQVASILTDTGVSAHHVELEITESVALGNQIDTEAVIADLDSMGLRIGIDDFGTGHSSLINVRRLPVKTIKIDTSFVRDIASDSGNAAIVSGTIAMAHLLGCQAVAEGVETLAQLQFLRDQGCDTVQGFLVSPAVPAAAFEALLASGQPLPPESQLIHV